MKFLKFLVLLTLTVAPISYAEKYQETRWDDLMPKGWEPPVVEEQSFFEGEAEDGAFIALPKTEFAPVVKKLDKQKLKIPGYMIPIKFNASSVTEFLLVPYVGACIHTPPPPENQIVYVTLKKPFESKDLWAPVWVSGIMKAQTSMTKFATAGYHLTEATTEIYDY